MHRTRGGRSRREKRVQRLDFIGVEFFLSKKRTNVYVFKLNHEEWKDLLKT